MTILGLAFLVAICAGAYGAIFVYANRHARPKTGPITPLPDPRNLPEATETLSVLTWNIGYAGLGEGADLIVDNGQSLRALPASEIARAAQGIADWLATRSSDIVCLQENAEAGFLTRKVPLRSIIEQALPDRQNIFWSDMKSVIAPAFLRLNHGMSVHTRVKLGEVRAKLFPQDDTYHLGLLKKHYGALISRSRISNTGFEWVVFNIHLSAFDERGHARRKQLQKLLSLAQQAYEAGHFVVIAGDWNMRLAPTDFPHQTAEKDLFWVTDFPQDSPPKGWQIVVDEGRPTVRTLNTAYRARETYTTIVDGFVISPNVELKHVSTTDNGFEFADHHAVEAKFVART